MAPAWLTQSWFPDLLNLSMAAPLEIPVVPDLLSQTVQSKTWTQPRNVQLSHLDVVRVSFKARGFSQETDDRIAVPQWASTRSIYDGKWAEFCSWCSRKKTDRVKATIPVVADFLVQLFERRPPLAVSTICGYRSAITNSKEIGDLMRSLADDRPVTKVFYPKWSLRIVLNYLTKERDPCALHFG